MSHSLTASPRAFILATLIAATTAAVASASSLHLSLPVWAMFIGWIAFFTRGLNTRSALENLGCVGLGMTIGVFAALAIPQVASVAGPTFALPVVVFVVGFVVVALRALPVMNNLLGYFLGLVAWFAAHLEPSLHNLLELFSASTIGSAAGWMSHRITARLARPA